MLYIAAFITGFLAALGVGGGMILLVYLTVFENIPQTEAQGINLIFFLPIAAAAVIIHYKNGLIDIKRLLPAIGTGAVCSAAGAFLAMTAGSELLRKFYGGFLILLGLKGIYDCIAKRRKSRSKIVESTIEQRKSKSKIV